ncbi:cysteine hydrolase family protein [Thioflexithrix psekupsensis]|nr:cysteine hydrolase family protein [Thioflexithrix psekupsensis]
MMKLQFLLIDPQNDFAHPQGQLYVPGADEDSLRLAALLQRYSAHIEAIHVTLDTHHLVDIAHPIFWIDKNGEHPTPFTQISAEDVQEKRWQTTKPEHQNRALNYVETLAKNGRYQLTIWPPHCLIGTAGHNVVEPVAQAIRTWEQQSFAIANYINKGDNIWTEHYSAVRADVPDPKDPYTQLNTALIQTLKAADRVAISGQALSHCVANTVRDIVANFGETQLDKLVLIEDTCSSVPGFEAWGAQFVQDMKNVGVQVIHSSDDLL